MEEFAERLSKLNEKWKFQLATCGEKIDIEKYGIEHNHCVDDNLMIRFAYKDSELMKFLGVEIHNVENTLFGTAPIPAGAIMLNANQYAIKKKNNSDKGQRIACGCMVSKDIGEYNTCPHLCEYCYANASKEIAVSNFEKAKQTNWKSETITGL
jgi:hypothetical protein